MTHDLVEAFLLADTLAVMKAGKFLQVGPPREIYQKPINSFVKNFIESYETPMKKAFPE